MRRLRALLAASALGVATDAHATLAPVTLDDLARRSDAIILGHVAGVHRVYGHLVAEVETIRVVKGPAATRSFVLAEPTWSCDISEANARETALIFLQRPEHVTRLFHRWLDVRRGPVPFYRIAASGRGRMPVERIHGREFAAVWTGDVLLPRDVATLDGPDGGFSLVRSARLADLIRAVERSVRAPTGPTRWRSR
jgi:hypothetical protein